ncbi:hypothetical protein CC2G_009662 [Coprinopsis cinerea AmutBmut pab1-1]|nr:hypothetical protein CC2G_009662 [Coprinopsis cinerea AmutBmut pab1-1]
MIETTVNIRKLSIFSVQMEYPETSWKIKPEGKDLFEEWLLRWDIDPDNWSIDASDSLKVHKLWLQNREPKFQRLKLPDLQQDVHEEIFDRCDDQQLLALSLFRGNKPSRPAGRDYDLPPTLPPMLRPPDSERSTQLDLPQRALRTLLQDSLPECKIANLHLQFSRPEANSIASATPWYILRICPDVRNLSVSLLSTLDDLVFPPHHVYSKFRCIEVLEWLSVHQLHPDGIPRLAEWLSSRPTAPNGNGDPSQSETQAERDSFKGLTHFKISHTSQIPPQYTGLLIASLHATPSLKFLTLEGLHLHSSIHSLIREISLACPNLVALKLVARTNNTGTMQNRTASGEVAVVWPHPSGAYAPALGGLKALKHFAWNYKLVDGDATPFALEFFERGVKPWERPGLDEQERLRESLEGKGESDSVRRRNNGLGTSPTKNSGSTMRT